MNDNDDNSPLPLSSRYELNITSEITLTGYIVAPRMVPVIDPATGGLVFFPAGGVVHLVYDAVRMAYVPVPKP